VPAPEFVLWPLIGLSALVAAVIDVKRGAVPAPVAWTALGLALLLRVALQGLGTIETGLLSGVLGALACATPFAVLALTGPRVGWNDVKLLAAVGAGFGIPRALAAVLLISVVGALAAIFFMVIRRRGSASVALAESNAAPRAAVDSARSIPYGVPIALGALWAMVWAGPAVPDVDMAPEVEVVADGGVPADEMVEPESQ
jgi:Flp pilus assembly protein protease CpaA